MLMTFPEPQDRLTLIVLPDCWAAHGVRTGMGIDPQAYLPCGAPVCFCEDGWLLHLGQSRTVTVPIQLLG
jgi:hypothetical protein